MPPVPIPAPRDSGQEQELLWAKSEGSRLAAHLCVRQLLARLVLQLEGMRILPLIAVGLLAVSCGLSFNPDLPSSMDGDGTYSPSDGDGSPGDGDGSPGFGDGDLAAGDGDGDGNFELPGSETGGNSFGVGGSEATGGSEMGGDGGAGGEGGSDPETLPR